MKTITLLSEEKQIAVDESCETLLIPRATYYRHLSSGFAQKSNAQNTVSQNALGVKEKQAVLDLLRSERFVDKTPYDVFYTLLDEGRYYCSPRTMYRILSTVGENQGRRLQRHHRDAIKPELIATGPNQVWSWDITKLRSLHKWNYFYLYVIVDIFSRYVVGWVIAECESKELARHLIHQSALKQGIPPLQLTLHSDNAPSMTSHTVAQLLEHLGIAKTHNRPYNSNDNPFSESQFKTFKYCPEFPDQFKSLAYAENFSCQFFTWYNQQHYHSGITWLTPESVHYGYAESILEKRHAVLTQAFLKNPERFNNKPPQKKTLPEAVYINPPQTVCIATLQKEKIMA